MQNHFDDYVAQELVPAPTDNTDAVGVVVNDVPITEPARETSLGRTIHLDTLADMRGGAEEVVDNDILVNGRVEDNNANRVVTGNNNVTGGSFANSNGISTVIQNTGANVLIQNAMIVNVKFGAPTP